MVQWNRWIVRGALALSLSATGSLAAQEVTAGADLTWLDTELRRLAAADSFSGVVLVAIDGETRFHRAYGAAERRAGRPVTPGMRFDIGSINKLFTATVIARLVQEGRLGLDDSLGEHLEGFRPNVAEDVTVRHLLTHRSGLGDYLSLPAFRADPKRFDEPAEFLPLARAQRLAFEPGTAQRYSNMGFVLLGAIIERVTGEPYHDIVQDMVFDPAGMATAGPAGGPDAARRYTRRNGRFVTADHLYPDVNSPAGGGFAAATDLVRFVEALLAHRLLDARHTALLLNGFDPAAEARPFRSFGFAGGAPGLNAVVAARPEAGLVIVVLANMDPPAANRLEKRVMNAMLERI